MKIRGQAPLEDLIRNGLKVGKYFSRQNDTIIDGSHCYMIEIGNHVTMSNGVHVLAHDASTNMHIGYTVIAPVHIGDYVFLGAKTLVLPGVTIGNRCIIGAGSVVTGNIPDNSVAVGNPARVIKSIDTYIDDMRAMFEKSPQFEEMSSNSDDRDASLAEIKKAGIGFIL
jgi:maltose O-acetyltransferase